MHDDQTSNASRREYASRLNRVLDHIDQHLAEPLELNALAGVAHFSPYHFHRLFAAWMGETLGEYLRRRRLEIAAQRLAANTQLPVLNIALEVGFGSGEAFARAFKERFDCTPTQWRTHARQRWAQELAQSRTQHRNVDQAVRKTHQANNAAHADDDGSTHPLQEITMNIAVLTLPAVRIAYLRHIGPYGPALGTFWRATVEPWLAANGLAGRITYGVGHDDPAITAPDKCRYDAGVEVSAGFTPNSGANLMSLPGGRYAVAHFTGNSSNIAAAWTEISAIGCPAAACKSTPAPASSATPRKARWTPQPGCLVVRFVCL
jgi:AraC family transcriptional regulator